MSPILGIWASAQQSSFVSSNSYESIATVTVGAGGSSSIDFTSIPSTYTHLQIRAIARTTAATSDCNLIMKFNSDTGNNYSSHFVYGTGAAASSGGDVSTSLDYAGRIPGANSSANIFGVTVIDILEYKNTNIYKTSRVLSGHDQNGSGLVFLYSGNWRNTNAITSISIKSDAGTGALAQYSHFALYGIKGA